MLWAVFFCRVTRCGHIGSVEFVESGLAFGPVDDVLHSFSENIRLLETKSGACRFKLLNEFLFISYGNSSHVLLPPFCYIGILIEGSSLFSLSGHFRLPLGDRFHSIQELRLRYLMRFQTTRSPFRYPVQNRKPGILLLNESDQSQNKPN